MEAELIDVHRDEVGHLKKMINQKDEELQKTVQKYEQVIQVLSQAWAWSLLFFLNFFLVVSHSLVGQNWISPTQHLEAISVGSCPFSCGFFWQTHKFSFSSSIAALVFCLKAPTAHYTQLHLLLVHIRSSRELSVLCPCSGFFFLNVAIFVLT